MQNLIICYIDIRETTTIHLLFDNQFVPKYNVNL